VIYYSAQLFRTGQLLAVECLSRFTFNGEFSHLSPEQFFKQADANTRVEIPLDQVSLIEKYKHWFRDNRIIVTLNVDDHSLRSLANQNFAQKIRELSCIHFEISGSPPVDGGLMRALLRFSISP
jgi:hypothetical protein